MKGVKIDLKGETICIAPDFGTTVFIYNRDGSYYVQASGLDDSMISHLWIDSQIVCGDTLNVEIADITETESSEPISKKKAFLESEKMSDYEIKTMNEQRLRYFHALEKMLKAENLL